MKLMISMLRALLGSLGLRLGEASKEINCDVNLYFLILNYEKILLILFLCR